jgi:hypothetical protein
MTRIWSLNFTIQTGVMCLIVMCATLNAKFVAHLQPDQSSIIPHPQWMSLQHPLVNSYRFVLANCARTMSRYQRRGLDAMQSLLRLGCFPNPKLGREFSLSMALIHLFEKTLTKGQRNVVVVV